MRAVLAITLILLCIMAVMVALIPFAIKYIDWSVITPNASEQGMKMQEYGNSTFWWEHRGSDVGVGDS
jgi:hypothetical protein